MTKKFLFLVVAILMGGMTAVKAKINYVPLYIVDTKPDVSEPHRIPAAPLFITQDDHKLILPEFEDSVTFMLYKDEECVYVTAYQQTIELPVTLFGDYEVRLCADTYYYRGYITLEICNKPDIPSETEYWDSISVLTTPLADMLDNLMQLTVVEYSQKRQLGEAYLQTLTEEQREAYIQNEEIEHQKRYVGLLLDEIKVYFPQLVVYDSGISLNGLVNVLLCCIQELKVELDTRTETIVDIMARGATPTAVREIGAAIGNTLLSAPPTSVNEPARVRYLLTDKVINAYIAVTDMSGRVMTRVPVSPSDTSVSIDSSALSEEGIFLCTLYANGEIIGTKRLVRTR